MEKNWKVFFVFQGFFFFIYLEVFNNENLIFYLFIQIEQLKVWLELVFSKVGIVKEKKIYRSDYVVIDYEGEFKI